MRDRQNRAQASKKGNKHALNSEITAREVRLVGAKGEQLGVLPLVEALRLAEEAGVDLVQVAAQSDPPVCRLLDYGKLKYEERKKQADAKKHGSSKAIKEIRVRYNTDSHDLETKIRNAKKFLTSGDRVKFQMRFRGRERSYKELGDVIFDKIIALLQEDGSVEHRTPMIGNTMSMTFVAVKAGGKK